MIGGGDAPPARIVLMSDGKETVKPSNLTTPYTAARAAGTGVPISTVSFEPRTATSRSTINVNRPATTRC